MLDLTPSPWIEGTPQLQQLPFADYRILSKIIESEMDSAYQDCANEPRHVES